LPFSRKQDGGSKLQKIIYHRSRQAIITKFGQHIPLMVPRHGPKPQVDQTGNGFLANFSASVRKSRFHQLGGAALGEPEVISTCGFHYRKLETQSRAWSRKKVHILFPLPVKKFPKSKKSKSHFSKRWSSSVTCCAETGSSIHSLSSASYSRRSASVSTKNRMTIGPEIDFQQIFKHRQFRHHVSDI